MDVSRINRSGQTSLGKPARSVSNAPGFSQLLETKPAAGQAVAGPASAGALDALLAVQEAESALDRRNRARRRAGSLIDGLDQIREGLLTGQVSPQRLESLAAMVSQGRDTVDDPQLSEILDEVEMRVHVELAKLGQLPR